MSVQCSCNIESVVFIVGFLLMLSGYEVGQRDLVDFSNSHNGNNSHSDHNTPNCYICDSHSHNAYFFSVLTFVTMVTINTTDSMLHEH